MKPLNQSENISWELTLILKSICLCKTVRKQLTSEKNKGSLVILKRGLKVLNIVTNTLNISHLIWDAFES